MISLYSERYLGNTDSAQWRIAQHPSRIAAAAPSAGGPYKLPNVERLPRASQPARAPCAGQLCFSPISPVGATLDRTCPAIHTAILFLCSDCI